MTDAELRDPRTWGAAPEMKVVVVETHVSQVVLVGDRAFKVKRPVRMPFLDFTTLEARREACAAELRLNRRLAPSIYLGVRALVPAAEGLRLAEADADDAVEFVVEMRRFDERDTLAARLAADRVTAAEVERVARTLAAFHRTAATGTAEGAPERARRALGDTFASLLTLLPQAERGRIAGLERFAASFLAEHWDALASRAHTGMVRDGHGDLRAEHVVLAPTLEMVDCLEFSDELRVADVGGDLAFLVMDLERADRSDLAAALIDGYRAAGGDPGTERMLAFFAMERALVRAKVALLRLAQVAEAERHAVRVQAAELLDLAERFAWRARGRWLLVACGPAASGKSTLAGALTAGSGVTVISSDSERKRLAGIGAEERGSPQLYDEPHDSRTRAAVLERADAALHRGSVVIDATCRDDAIRQAVIALAADAGVRLLVAECRLPRAELSRRARIRELKSDDVSDAGESVALAQWDGWRAWDDVPAGSHVLVRADAPLHRQLGTVADAIDRP